MRRQSTFHQAHRPLAFRSGTRRLIAIVTLLAAGIGPVADARVFRRWGGHAEAIAVLSGSRPGQPLYESRAHMNGIAGNARVASYDVTLDALREALHHPDFRSNGGTATRWMIGHRHILGIPTSGETGQRTLFIDRPDTSTVLGIRFTPTDAHRPGESARAPVVSSGLPVYPGAAVAWSLELDASGMAIYSATATDHPDTVRSHIDGHLRGNGWQAALPPATDGGRQPAMGDIYVRGNALMAIQVSRSRYPDRPARILVVRKQR